MLSSALRVATCEHPVHVPDVSPYGVLTHLRVLCKMRSCQQCCSYVCCSECLCACGPPGQALLAAQAPGLQPLAQPPAEVTAWLGVARKAIWSALWQPLLDFRAEWQVWPHSSALSQVDGPVGKGVSVAVQSPPTATRRVAICIARQ